VATRARFVRIEEVRIEEYARDLAEPEAEGPAEAPSAESAEAVAAYAICMNAINFGSGWWPTIHKRPGLSGYGTMAAGLEERFEAEGPWQPEQLRALDAVAVAGVLDQDPEHPLMAQFAAALRDVGEHLAEEHGGRYLGVVEAADSIPTLAATFAGWDSFADVSTYEGRRVPFFKRAQIAAADLALTGIAPAADLDRLTLFADNLVPHVLRLDGVLEFDDDLVARIEAEQPLVHGAPEEVEIRACAVHAVELLVAAHGATTATAVDNALWHRGAGARYKARPRHRAPCTAY